MAKDSGVAKTSREIIQLLSLLFGRITNPAGLTVAILFLAVFYLIPNHQLIGSSPDLIYSYSIMFILMLLWAFYRKVPLEKMDWTAKDILKHKYIKSPRQAHWAFLLALGAFVITVAYALIRYNIEKADYGSQLAIEMMWQQLLVVTLAETVIFQALFPLIVEWELEQSPEYKKISPIAILAVVIIVSQGFFAVSHYMAYGGNWWTIFQAFIPGTIWYISGRYFGIQTAWWSHFGWNCVALGLIGV